MACEYIYKGKTFKNYRELHDSLKKEMSGRDRPDAVYDYLFSMEIDAQKCACDALDKIVKECREMRRADEDGNETSPDIGTETGAISARRLLDMPFFFIHGDVPMFRLDRDSFMEHQKRVLVASGMSEADAQTYCVNEVARWDRICEDALALHNMMVQSSVAPLGQVAKTAEETSFRGMAQEIADLYVNINKMVKREHAYDKTGAKGGREPKIYRNVNFSGDLVNVPEEYKTVTGHADFIAVDGDGFVEIYNIVASAEPRSAWSREKVEHYRYEAAFIKKILAQKGVDTTRARVKVIPVQIEYDGGFGKVLGLNLQRDAVINLDMSKSRYIGERYDSAASRYIETTLSQLTFTTDAMKRANDKISFIFPSIDARADGVKLDAVDWVQRNWYACSPKRREDGPGYVLTIPETGEQVPVEDMGTGKDNREFVRWVEEHMSRGHESFGGRFSADIFIRHIINSMEMLGYFDAEGDDIVNKKYIKEKLAEYFVGKKTETDAKGKKHFTYRWEVIDSPELRAVNLVALRNKDTHQLDLIRIIMNDPGGEHLFRPENHTLLGAYLDDLNPYNFRMRSNWANIEAMCVVNYLNEVSDKLVGDVKLGKLKILSLNELGRMRGETFDFDSLVKEFDTVVKVVNKETGGKAGLENKLYRNGVNYITTEEAFIQMWRDIIDFGGRSYDITEIKGFRDLIEGHTDALGNVVPGLIDEEQVHAKERLILELMRRIRGLLGDGLNGKGGLEINVRDVEEIYNNAKNTETYAGTLSRLYVMAADLLRVYTGRYIPDIGELTTLDSWMSRPEAVGEEYYTVAVDEVQSSIGRINSDVARNYANCRKFCDELYKDAGYSKLRNAIIGDQSVVYRNMFVYGEDGENTYMFKNPYDDNADLLGYERKFLKNILYEFYKVRCRMNGKKPEIKGPDDPVLKDTLPAAYLNLPLERRSKVSRRSDVKGFLKDRTGQILSAVTDWHGAIEKVKKAFGKLTDMSDYERAAESFEEMTVHNKFKRFDSDSELRNSHISEMGANWFENNVENVFIDYLYTQTRCEEMDILLYKINSLELALKFRGLDYKDTKNVKKILQQIDDYVKVNVHKGTLMEKQSVMFERVTGGLRRLVTQILFGNNLYGFVRDNFYGLLSNWLSVASGFETKCSVESLRKAYMFVWLDGLKNLKDMGFLKQLNVKYGFSSFDFGNVSTKLKSEGGAAFDWQGWMYWTMKEPDYLNRMTLFVARLYEDGSLPAYGVDADGNMVYNWRDDGRFSVLARDDGSDPNFFAKLSEADKKAYKEQKARYYSLVSELNTEDPKLGLKVTDDLPDGYTMREINEIKTLGKRLYGAYDQADQNKLASMAIGRNFMFFFNFFNGINDIYFGKTRLSYKFLKETFKYDEKGNQLFWTDDGLLTIEDTGMPVTEKSPTMTAGIFPVIKTAVKSIAYDLSEGKTLKESFDNYYHMHYKDNEVAKKNFRRLGVDMAVTAVFALLYEMLVKPEYRRHKEEDDPERLVQNICIELMYRGWARSADFFSGPFALLKYFGDNTNPVTYDIGMKMVTDAYKVMSGNATFGSTLLTYSAFYRSMQDSLRAFYKDMAQQNGTAAEEEARKREKEQRKGRTGTVK